MIVLIRQAGVVKPVPQDFALQPVLYKIEREFGLQADDRDLVYRCRETDAVVHCDPALVELILRNLVANAIRYTRQGGLLVACRLRAGQAVLEVWDTGVGIAPEQHKEVFREFTQLSNPERDRRKGLGLGLAIAQGLAQRLGQTLTLSSRVGRGSVFRLTLPIATQAGAAVPLAAAAASGGSAIEPPRCQARVLVLEDDPAIRSGLQQLLLQWGCECDPVESLEQALEIVRHHPPAAVICDYRLRGQNNGITAIAALRAVLGPALPAMLLTGDTDPERLIEAHASGILLLHKPVSADDLRHNLGALLEHATN